MSPSPWSEAWLLKNHMWWVSLLVEELMKPGHSHPGSLPTAVTHSTLTDWASVGAQSQETHTEVWKPLL
jgi:hypothetical protein